MQNRKVHEEEWKAIKEEICKELKAEIREEVCEEIKSELKNEIRVEMSEARQKEIQKEMQIKMQGEENEIQAPIKKHSKRERKRKKNKNPLLRVAWIEILSLFVGIVILCFVTHDISGVFGVFYRYVDIMILLLLLVLTLPTVVSSGLWNDFIKVLSLYKPEQGWRLCELKRSQVAIEVMQKQLLYAAIMIIMFQLISMLYTMTELLTLGPSLSNIFMTGLYTAIMELLLMPLKIEVQKQIADFMEEH